MSATTDLPNVQDGINYWESQPASLDGVLGGFGSCSLPRVDALGSRKFLLSLLPELSLVPSAIRRLKGPYLARRIRALDVGAGIGRVTSTVLLHLVSDVVLLEPADNLVREALRKVSAASTSDKYYGEWKGVQQVPNARPEAQKSVTIVKGTLQDFNPLLPPGADGKCELLKRVGYAPAEDDSDTGFDVIWCQWCLGHLNDEDLVSFLIRCKESLRTSTHGFDLDGLIIVKENVCSESTKGVARKSFDKLDSSLTRSDTAWKGAFRDAGLTLIKEEVQKGFPLGLYEVKIYALR
ncbi:methyltransferase domain-containing [Pyrrhoderma noxium]|uniref:Alpha N-terminal protein methyltransferase 1 n=1 Tax=Pyrrhoderma noxium TaxID=2282107 RepID=A0A286UWJ4_9AGAM|nr:methyltransferase domain-containing [Pyrrhoderma noxium]